METQTNPSAKSSMPCLSCGYDLRGAIGRQSFGLLVCPECGKSSEVQRLHRYGVRAATIGQLAILVIAPQAILLISSWVFAVWSRAPIHACLSLMLAPIVVAAHIYAVWQFIDATVVLTEKQMYRIRMAVCAIAAGLDIVACALVAWWFL